MDDLLHFLLSHMGDPVSRMAKAMDDTVKSAQSVSKTRALQRALEKNKSLSAEAKVLALEVERLKRRAEDAENREIAAAKKRQQEER